MMGSMYSMYIRYYDVVIQAYFGIYVVLRLL
jgi:hypothetical protein